LVLSSGHISGQNSIVSFEQLTTEAIQFEKIEFNIEIEGTYSNPYNSDEITIDFKATAPSGKDVTLPCYYDSKEEIWKARFAPRQVGIYKSSIIVKQLGAVAEESGEKIFEVKKSLEGKGFLSAHNYWAFKFDNGECFRGIGINIGWEGRSWDNPQNLFSYEHYLPKLFSNGANFIRTWMCQWNFPLEWQKVSNDTYRYSNKTEYFHPEAIERLDEFVTMCSDNHVYVMLSLDVHGSIVGDEWLDSPYNVNNGGPCNSRAEYFTNEEAKKKYKDRLRYIVGRWGYSPNIAVWELFNEIDNVSAPLQIPHKVITDWHNEMSSYLKNLDPYNHLISTSISHREIAGLNSIESIDFNQKHIYHDGRDASDIVTAIESYTAQFQKPYVIGECGWTWDWNKDFSNPLTQENLVFDFKRALWYGVFNETPIFPMNWWWEFFDRQNVLYYFRGVQEISAQMLIEGEGEFQKVPVKSTASEAYALKVGDDYYVYGINKSFTSVVASLSLTTLESSKTFYLQEYNPENQMSINMETVKTDHNGIVELSALPLPSRHGAIYIFSVVKRSENLTNHIEAENFSNSSGVIVESSVDSSGGKIVKEVDDLDWMTFNNVMLPYTGDYVLTYRVSSINVNGVLQLEEAGNTENPYGTIEIPASSGEWITIQHVVALKSGSKDLGMKVLQGGWSFDWFSITPILPSNIIDENGVRGGELKVFPNPGKIENLKFQITIDRPELASVVVFDMNGSEVGILLQELMTPGQYIVPLSCNLSSGSYVVRFTTQSVESSMIFIVE